jgi:hypothetical protein
VRKAQAAAAQAQINVLELQSKGITGERLSAAQEIASLAQQSVTGATNYLGTLGNIQALERETLGLNQATEATKLRANAASKGMEGSLSGSLTKLAGIAQVSELTATRGGKAETAFQGLAGQVGAALRPAEQFASLDIAGAVGGAASEANGLANNMATAAGAASDFYNTLAAAADLPSARWSGGPVDAGQAYKINELGQEAFLSNSGRVSLIHRAANSLWTAPSSGLVLPAGMTARLQEQGVLPGGPAVKGGSPRVRAMGARPQSGAGTAISELRRAVVGLTAEVAELRRKDWTVQVHERGRNRHQQVLGMLGQLT